MRAATKGMLEGVSVSSRPWFTNGLKGSTVEDVHDAKLLDRLLRTSPDQAPFRFVDVAIPVRLPDGKLAGVLGAHMSWTWADEVRRTVLSSEQAQSGAQVWVLAHDGTMLLGPKGKALPKDGLGRKRVHIFTDDTDDLLTRTAVVQTQGYRSYPGLGWQVAARRPVTVIYAPADSLVREILLVGALALCAATVVAWLVAETVAGPLRKLSEELDVIGRTAGASSVARQHGSRDVLHLSAAIRSLLRRVGSAEAEQDLSSSTIASLRREMEKQAETSKAKIMRIDADIHDLRILADTDAMTGLLNRRAFLPYAEQAYSDYNRTQKECSFLMFDIDHFKAINDTFGHSTGDDVIRRVADVLREETRVNDKIARFGGEEFVLLLPETSSSAAAETAERLRQAIAACRVQHGDRTIDITVSVGCATSDATGRDVEDFIQRADQSLYAAKASGRNRVRSFGADNAQGQAAA